MAHRSTSSSPPAPWQPALAAALPYSIVAAVVAVVLARRGAALAAAPQDAARRVAQSLLTLETVALAVTVPLLAARCGEGRRRWLWGVAVPVGTMAAVTLVVILVATGGLVPVDVLASCQAFALCFAAVLAAGVALLSNLGLRPSTAQLAVSAAALALVANVFATNALIEAMPAGPPRIRAIGAVIWTNPWVVASGSLLEADPLRAERLYDRSVISSYGFAYPGAGRTLTARTLIVCAAYAVPALALGAAAWGAARRRASTP
ncbi:MAG: hypothetical protein ACODAJ_07385 [Planctomycetota bacterium]